MERKYKVLVFGATGFTGKLCAKYLKEKGAEVEILTGKPNYPGGDLFRDFKQNPSKFFKYKLYILI